MTTRVMPYVAAVLISLAAAVAFAQPAPAASGESVLRTGETLLPGQYLIFNRYQLVMQTDGNLVLYERIDSPPPPHRRACAASHTTAYPGSRAWMSPDGRFSVFTPAPGNRIVWSTGPTTLGWQNARVSLDSSGNANVRSGDFQHRFIFWHC